MLKLFEPYTLKNLNLKNKLVMPPMCMYQADNNGFPTDFHFTHYTMHALGGVSLIIQEATAVTSNGRITSKDLGIYEDAHIPGLKKIVDGVHAYNTKIAIQLGHAGRKSEVEEETPDAPSALPANDGRLPHEMTIDEIKATIQAFKEAARRANEAGYDAIEIHGAHGYLIHEFLSPLSNKRQDQYGKPIQFLKEILEAIHTVWPSEKAILLRVSASDYLEGGLTVESLGEILKDISGLYDLLHVSSGGLLLAPIQAYPGYQVEFSRYLKNTLNVPTIAVGILNEEPIMEEVLRSNRADLIAVGRALLSNPFLLLQMAHAYNQEIEIPSSYLRAFRKH